MTTTIKVSTELRDRLKTQATRDGLTLGGHLARLAEADERRHSMVRLRAAVAESTDEQAQGHAAESTQWERAELTDAGQ